MTAPRGPGGPADGPTGSPNGSSNGGVPSAVRGAVLVGLAVIVGIIGLQIIDDSGPGSGGGGATIDTVAGATTTPGATVTTTATGDTTATTSPSATSAPTATTTRRPKPNGDVKVKVFNASGVPGVAQAMTDRLKAAGYDTLTPANLDQTRTGSVVQCRKGFAIEGKLIVFTQVKTDATYEPFPSDPPDGSDDADCIVIIGKAA